MNNLLTQARIDRVELEQKRTNLSTNLETLKVELEECRRDLYNVAMREMIITEIYRLASIQFPRLRRENGHVLTPMDIQELDKWIKRAHCLDSLQRIVDALRELEKYQPVEIRSNLYALVQKIILGGAFHGKRKS